MSRNPEQDQVRADAPTTGELADDDLESVAGGGALGRVPGPEPIVPIDPISSDPVPLPGPSPILPPTLI